MDQREKQELDRFLTTPPEEEIESDFDEEDEDLVENEDLEDEDFFSATPEEDILPSDKE